jgi:hypothetical protein
MIGKRATFRAASDAELQVMRDMVDALAREEPRRIFTDPDFCNIVHAVNGEVGHRVSQRQLNEQRLRRLRKQGTRIDADPMA